jgi:hypothetical protein
MVFFGKNGRVCEEAEINNAWRGAMAVWQHLGQKYVLGFSNVILDSKKVWSLADDARLSMSEKICLCSTFDNQIAYKKDFKRLSEAFSSFVKRNNIAIFLKRGSRNCFDILQISNIHS